MGKFVISLCLCCWLSSVVSAATIVRHEHTAGKIDTSNVIVSAADKEVSTETNGDEVLVVYGPFKEPAFEVQENDGVVTGKDAGKKRVDKFLGDYVGKENPRLRRGQQNGIDYVDSIYLFGKDSGREDYVIAIRKQLDHATQHTTYLSFILLMGRGENAGTVFDTAKLPRLELWNNGVGKVIAFQHAWVNKPWGFMLRMNADQMAAVVKADKVDVLLDISSGAQRITIPRVVIEQWRLVDNI